MININNIKGMIFTCEYDLFIPSKLYSYKTKLVTVMLNKLTMFHKEHQDSS